MIEKILALAVAVPAAVATLWFVRSHVIHVLHIHCARVGLFDILPALGLWQPSR